MWHKFNRTIWTMNWVNVLVNIGLNCKWFLGFNILVAMMQAKPAQHTHSNTQTNRNIPQWSSLQGRDHRCLLLKVRRFLPGNQERSLQKWENIRIRFIMKFYKYIFLLKIIKLKDKVEHFPTISPSFPLRGLSAHIWHGSL